MSGVHTPRKIAAWALLVVILDIIIFHRGDTVDCLTRVVALLPRSLFEPVVAIMISLPLLRLLPVLRSLTSSTRYLWGASDHALKAEAETAAEKELRTNRIQVIATVVQALGGTALLIGIIFAWFNLNLAQEGQITDRYIRAVDQLGADKDGHPVTEIRIGGIYVLWRIPQDSS